jgi:hypothetical protein
MRASFMAEPDDDKGVIESLCAVQSELPSSAHVRCNPSDVALRAYEIYESRGCLDGWDVDDWLQAERELNRLHDINS